MAEFLALQATHAAGDLLVTDVEDLRLAAGLFKYLLHLGQRCIGAAVPGTSVDQ
jgi:hypothetical protein